MSEIPNTNPIRLDPDEVASVCVEAKYKKKLSKAEKRAIKYEHMKELRRERKFKERENKKKKLEGIPQSMKYNQRYKLIFFHRCS